MGESGGIFGGGKGAGIGSVIGGAGGLGTTAFRGRQKISPDDGRKSAIAELPADSCAIRVFCSNYLKTA